VNGLRNAFFWFVLLSSSFLQGMEERERRNSSPSFFPDRTSPTRLTPLPVEKSDEEVFEEMRTAQASLNACMNEILTVEEKRVLGDVQDHSQTFIDGNKVWRNVERGIKREVYSWRNRGLHCLIIKK
jgi:hypothetical protein